MINTKIEESKWAYLTDVDVENNTPYWLKLKNGNVVLSAYIQSQHASGWAACTLSAEGVNADLSTFYIAKDAKIQDALIK